MMTNPHRKSDARLGATDRTLADGVTPGRQCAVTRDRLPLTEMVRFALSPDNIVVPDISGKLPGRGVWVKADRATLEAGLKAGAFARGFKSQVTVPDDLVDQVENLLLRRCQGIIGMAKKAGDVVVGYDQVRDALRKTAPGLLLEATDGAEDGRGKVYFLAKALYSEVKIAGALNSVELGMAFGRDRVIHGYVRRGSIAKSLLASYGKLTGFRRAPELDWFPDQEQ